MYSDVIDSYRNFLNGLLAITKAVQSDSVAIEGARMNSPNYEGPSDRILLHREWEDSHILVSGPMGMMILGN